MYRSVVEVVLGIICMSIITCQAGQTDLDMRKIMEWVTFKFENKTNVVNIANNSPCQAKPDLTLALTYLRSISVSDSTGAVKSREEIESQIKSHPEFYYEKLKALQDPKNKLSVTTCEITQNLICFVDVCQNIWQSSNFITRTKSRQKLTKRCL